MRYVNAKRPHSTGIANFALPVIILIAAGAAVASTSNHNVANAYTTTYKTTVEVTYNYLTVSGGRTSQGGYLSTTTMTFVTTENATGLFTGPSSEQNAPAVPGFSMESLVAGVVLGMLVISLTRRKTNHRL